VFLFVLRDFIGFLVFLYARWQKQLLNSLE
jgi:hypothetical protein